MVDRKVLKRHVIVEYEYNVHVNVHKQDVGRGRKLDDEADFDRRVIRAVRRELTRGGER